MFLIKLIWFIMKTVFFNVYVSLIIYSFAFPEIYSDCKIRRSRDNNAWKVIAHASGPLKMDDNRCRLCSSEHDAII